MKFIYLLCFFYFASSNSIALVKSVERPKVSVLNQTIELKSVYGENTSVIKIGCSNSKSEIEFVSQKHEIKKYIGNNYACKVIATKIKELSKHSNKKINCTRNYLLLTAHNLDLLGCLGSDNKLSNQLVEILNFLSYYY